MDLSKITVADALKVLNLKGHTFLAGEFEKTVNSAIASLGGQLPQGEETRETETPQGGTTPAPAIADPIQAMIESRGYSFPPNSR